MTFNRANAVAKIAESISEDLPRAANSVLYDPSFQASTHTNGESKPDTQAEQIQHDVNIPVDLVGCLIGKGGKFINHLRRVSGAKINVSDREDDQSDRIFVIKGTKASVDKALEMVFAQLEKEKKRRMEQAEAEGKEQV